MKDTARRIIGKWAPSLSLPRRRTFPLLTGERPYSGLLFLANTRLAHLADRSVSYLSTLALRLLGTDVPEAIQNGLHELTN